MKRDTPLPDVARMLPTGVAKGLIDEPPDIQKAVCSMIRDAVCYWEEQGVILEPITYEVVMVTFAAQAMATVRKLLALEAEVITLRRLVHGTP